MLIASAAWTVMVRVPDLTLKGRALHEAAEPKARELAKSLGVSAGISTWSAAKSSTMRIKKDGKPTHWVRFSQMFVVEAAVEVPRAQG